MSTYTFQDAVAIDTNVFVHLLNREHNDDGHIHLLLVMLAEQGVKLLVDNRDVIQREYARNVIPMLAGDSVNGGEVYLLQYFMDVNFQQRVTVNPRDELMAAIRQVIVEPSKNADRTFVYVAFHEGKLLISNDWTDIVDGPDRERMLTPRRNRLRRETRRLCPKGADILTSEEAHDQIL